MIPKYIITQNLFKFHMNELDMRFLSILNLYIGKKYICLHENGDVQRNELWILSKILSLFSFSDSAKNVLYTPNNF